MCANITEQYYPPDTRNVIINLYHVGLHVCTSPGDVSQNSDNCFTNLESGRNCLCGFVTIKPTDALIFQIHFVKKLYMFRAVSLPIIRSFPLYIRHWYMSYRFDNRFQAESGWNWRSILTQLESGYQTCMTYTSAECTGENS